MNPVDPRLSKFVSGHTVSASYGNDNAKPTGIGRVMSDVVAAAKTTGSMLLHRVRPHSVGYAVAAGAMVAAVGGLSALPSKAERLTEQNAAIYEEIHSRKMEAVERSIEVARASGKDCVYVAWSMRAGVQVVDGIGCAEGQQINEERVARDKADYERLGLPYEEGTTTLLKVVPMSQFDQLAEKVREDAKHSISADYGRYLVQTGQMRMTGSLG